MEQSTADVEANMALGDSNNNHESHPTVEKQYLSLPASPREESECPAPPLGDKNNPVPDGGAQAWLQVLGAFFLFFNTFGLTNAFGVYQTYYESGILFSTTSANISWIGSIQGFLLQFIGPITGPLYDAGYFRTLIILGSFLVIFGQIMLSFCVEYYQVLLSQALCIGIGTGCLFLPCVAVLSQYFDKRLATATGLAAVGSSLGGIIYPIMLYRLLPRIGFAWATRVLGFTALITLLIAVLTMKVRILPPSKRAILDVPAFREAPYTLFTIGCFFSWLGLYGPYFYVSSFSISSSLASESLSFYSLAVINAGSVFGRLISNYAADRTGSLNMIVPASIISGILAFCLISVRHISSLLVISALFGFSSGSLVSLYSTVYIRLSAHKPFLIGTRMGMGLLTTSFALLLGTPIFGWIIGASDFAHGWLFSGLALVAGGVIMAAARISKTKGRLLIKA